MIQSTDLVVLLNSSGPVKSIACKDPQHMGPDIATISCCGIFRCSGCAVRHCEVCQEPRTSSILQLDWRK